MKAAVPAVYESQCILLVSVDLEDLPGSWWLVTHYPAVYSYFPCSHPILISSKSVLSLWRLYRQDMINGMDKWVSMLVEGPWRAKQSSRSEVAPSKAMY